MFKGLIAFSFIFLAACVTQQSLRVTGTDPETGYFPSELSCIELKNKPFDIDSRKDLLLVRDHGYTGNMVKNIGYFDEIIDIKDLETIIAKNDLSATVPTVHEQLGIHKAAKAYKPFLQIRWDRRDEGEKIFQQLKLTDPVDLEDYFVCESPVNFAIEPATDKNSFYPMMNALIDYIRKHSNTF